MQFANKLELWLESSVNIIKDGLYIYILLYVATLRKTTIQVCAVSLQAILHHQTHRIHTWYIVMLLIAQMLTDSISKTLHSSNVVLIIVQPQDATS